MSAGSPFSQDPAQTAAFARLSAKLSARPHGEASPLKAVVIGGGTGAPVSIRTLLSLDAEVSAVVAMADDGGSTGVIREEAGSLAPGDIRKCLVAMARDHDDPLTRAFKYRFAFAGDHALGNLMLAALEDATGSFPRAIEICEGILEARGHVFPSTLDPVVLTAVTRDGDALTGQAQAGASTCALGRVSLSSEGSIEAYLPALRAIEEADLVVLGPGSLYTSIIPNLLVPGIVDAIRASSATTVFVCAVADVQGETRGMRAVDHYRALASHGMEGLVDYMLVHSATPLSPGACATVENDVEAVGLTYDEAVELQSEGVVVLVRDLADHMHPTWHYPEALREAFCTVLDIDERRSARVFRP
ncbi:gluconeogenesis factor YvcK family protein [Slackia exigua]|uniref:Putative gluconeogenesis factor n=2 Tax=Slackia TaxID=84108 RepID=D0WEL8_SLAES|nr:gluconeogenesis factor YvcK family protein [Slackia exigua]EEZ62156.1 hypothetical protein HMPREF0762_00248 [Slackia exigua ATCC 700122]STN98629.1 LPPG:FO 2-phospho-L-lactate transferase [Slackia exigua]